jgi:hypothetical protein
MPVEDFLDMMPDTVTVEPWVAQDGLGAPAFGPARSYRARVEVSPRLVRNLQGEEVVSTARVYLGTRDAVSERDRLTLPAGFTQTQPSIIRVSPVRDEAGVHHIQVWT